MVDNLVLHALEQARRGGKRLVLRVAGRAGAFDALAHARDALQVVVGDARVHVVVGAYVAYAVALGVENLEAHGAQLRVGHELAAHAGDAALVGTDYLAHRLAVGFVGLVV